MTRLKVEPELLANERISDYDIREINRMRDEIKALKWTLGTLIGWMVASAVSPIRRDEAAELLKNLESADR